MFSLSFITSITKLRHLLFNYARLLSGVVFFILLSACASTPQTDLLLQSIPQRIPFNTELDDVPFFPQQQYQCGPAALATMLNHQHLDVNAETLVDKVYIPERKGSLQLEVLATARSYGLITYPINPELTDLLTEIAAGHPVLIFQNLSLRWFPQWHYAVVVGYNLNTEELILRSGTHRRHVINMATFERTWARAKFWGYVMLPPTEIPATASPEKYLHAVHQFAQSGSSEKAYMAYQQAVKHWPNNELMYMALGNTGFQLQKYTQASQNFIHVIQINNTNASAWNNLAYTFMARQCYSDALLAVECAEKLSPNDANIQASKKEIAVSGSDKTRCPIPQCPRF